MIPKIIHYCWFGGNPLPKSAQKCIASWKKFFPDYEIREWNESNYDVQKIPYIREAYAAKKYAFVSDYARFDLLYHHGGLYFDTDVEVIRPFDDILENGAFMGCETDGTGQGGSISVAPGLGIAAEAGMPLYGEILAHYGALSFLQPDGKKQPETVVHHTTNILRRHGLTDLPGKQTVAGVTVYPKDYFNPLNNNTGKLDKTPNTHSVHRYSMTWLPRRDRVRSRITRVFHRLFGEDCFRRIKER